MADPVKLQPPRSNQLFIIFRVVSSINRTPFAALGEVPLNFCDGPNQEPGEEITLHIHRPPGQLTLSTPHSPQRRADLTGPFVFRQSTVLGLRRRGRRLGPVRQHPPWGPVHISHEPTSYQHIPGDSL